jgi:16S rRNA (uracil1498-N3)-methyltransferase
MKRFLVRQSLSVGARLQLNREESRHALKVLRLAVGDHALVADGQGQEAKARVVSADRDGVWLEVEALSASARPQAAIELIQGVLKGPRMDWLVEKITELGVETLRPVTTDFSVSKGEREDRWERIAESALKQSGNLRLPDILRTASLAEALAGLGEGFRVHLHPSAPFSLAKILAEARNPGRVILAVGPEGGFSPAEEKLLAGAGFRPAALSKNVLRGETGAIVAAAITRHLIDF